MTSADLDDMPRQAVVLAGGLGTRLGPLTQSIPKPLAPVNGVPFLAYLLRMLRNQGIDRIILLIGYKADMIRDYCGDGSKFGLKISYSEGPVDDDTGTRVRRIQNQVDEHFLLLYCDNYWPMPLSHMWRSYCEKTSADAQVTVYRNSDKITKSNLKVSDGGLVETYDKSRKTPGLSGVDIGFILLNRRVLKLLPQDGNFSFEAELYPKLSANGQLAAFETDHRYYSIGSPERLEQTARFLSRNPCVILDRDGVLNVKAARGEYITSPEEWQWLPGSREAMRAIREAGSDIVVVTNQAGIARGMLTEQDLEAVHSRMREEAAQAGGDILDIFHCPHHWDDNCDCRKPKPGMLVAAQREHGLDLSVTPFVGDDPRDGEAADLVDEPFFKVDFNQGVAQAIPALLDFVKNRGQGIIPNG